MKTLYLCYFGLREPLVQTQVLPYLRQLSDAGIDVSLLTFEPGLARAWTCAALLEEQARLAKDGIKWSSLAYHKRPSAPATLYDIWAGARAAARLMRERRIDVLHARAHIPLAMGLLVKRWTDCRLVFDLRGLMAEEYADAGVWTEQSQTFRAIKRLERAGLHHSDQIIVLTWRMKEWLIEHELINENKIEVIPCCVDFARFNNDDDEGRERATDAAGQPASAGFEVIYAGAVTGLYLLEEMGRFFLQVRARCPRAFFRVLTTAEPREAAAVLKRVGLGADDFWIGAASPAEVPVYLRRARLGLSFRKPSFSQIAASPTKIPEYLAAGLPTVGNAGIGDVDDLLEKENVGVVVREFTTEAYARAAEQALALAEDERVRARCVEVARRHFDLQSVGGRRYQNVYRRLRQEDAAGG